MAAGVAAFSQIRVNVNLVQLDAVVTDSRGRVVPDLSADDFEILQDGRPQKITNFLYVRTLSEVSKGPAPKPANAAAPSLPPPPMALKPEQVRRTLALVVDDLGLSFDGANNVRRALLKFVDQQMQTGDLVAIIRTGAGLGALQQFTADKRILHAAIDRVRFNPMSRTGGSSFAPIEYNPVQDTADAAQAASGTANDTSDQVHEKFFSMGTLGALHYVVEGLGDIPGRKSVLLFSENMRLFHTPAADGAGRFLERDDSLTGALQQLAEMANRASVVFYTIDPRGLVVTSATAADDLRGSTSPVPAPPRPVLSITRSLQQLDEESGLVALAKDTGGLFLNNTNDVATAVERVLQDQEGYYLLGYRPDESSVDFATGARRFLRATVKVKRAGLHVRYRSGGLEEGGEPAKPAPTTRKESMQRALTSPFFSGAVHLKLTTLFSNSAADGSYVDALLHIDANDVTFSSDGKGVHQGGMDILTVTFGDRGEAVEQSGRTFSVQLNDSDYQLALRNGLIYSMRLPIHKAGAYQVRAAVADSAGKIGSASQFVETPEVAGGAFALSGIVLKGAVDPTPGAGPSAKEPMENPAVRIFKPGHLFTYGYQIYNLLPGADGRSQATAQTILFHDGQAIYTGKPSATSFDAPGDAKRRIAGGQLTLASRMEPGDYTLQVIVTDVLAKGKPRTATQYIDFVVQP